jgi:hypothetical protein
LRQPDHGGVISIHEREERRFISSAQRGELGDLAVRSIGLVLSRHQYSPFFQ